MLKRFLIFIIFIMFSLAVFGDDVMKEGHSPGKWTQDYDAAVKYAKENKKHILLNFTGSDWCGWCKLMDKQVFAMAAWKAYAAQNLALVYIDFPRNTSLVPAKFVQRNKDLQSKHNVSGYPTYLLVSADGSTVLGKTGAGREKTPEIFAAELAAIIKANKITELKLPESFGVSSSEISSVNKALLDFAGQSKEEQAKSFEKVFKELQSLVGKDPVNFTFLNSQAVVSLIPHCSESDLQVLAGLSEKTSATGSPIDDFLLAVDKASQNLNGDLPLTYKYMSLFSIMNRKEKVKELLPDIEILKKNKDLKEAQPWLNIVKNVSTKNYLEFCFAMQNKDLPKADRLKMAEEIASLCSMADDEFMNRWFKSISNDAELLKALKANINNSVKAVIKSQDFSQRATVLSSNILLVNKFSEIKPDAEISRVALRHWGLEYANGLVNYRQNKKAHIDPRTRRQTREVIKSIDFEKIVAAQPSDKTLSVLSEEEIKLFKFQQSVATVKTGKYDQEALDILISFKDKYPQTVARYCSDYFVDWAQKVNPNKVIGPRFQQSYVSYYQQSGMNYIQESTGIPLTRSRQVKNLRDCSAMFKKVYQAGLEVKPQEQIQAFVSCFSNAEIITEDEIRLVFGDMTHVTDGMMVQMVDHVVSLINNNWVNKKNQQQIQADANTNRSEAQAMDEITKAFQGIINITEERLQKNSENVELSVRLASIYYTSAEFQYENKLCTLEEYTQLRDNAFTRFSDCASLYEKMLEKGSMNYTIAPYRFWFSVIIGASDLNTLEVSNPVSNTHLDKVKNSLFGMNEKWRDRHVKMFGDWVSSIWSGLNPNVKLSFLESVKEVIGSHPSIESIEKQLELYKSFLTEVKLIAKVDGSTDIGEKEFGMLVSIQHTPELEREASGFRKYVQNQIITPTQRTPIDYQKNFARNIHKALKDKFEVNGLTWLDPGVNSQESTVLGWRETPLVYVKLKAKDSSVDRIPSVQLDMDFNDGPGKVVLPVLSNVVLVNGQQAAERPAANVVVELVLDARGAKEGKVSLEVKITGEGMLPNLAKMLEADPGYTLKGIDEASPVIVRLEQVGNEVIPKSELTTDIKLDWQGKLEKFTFPKVLRDDVQVLYKQYKDADIVPAQKTVYISDASSKNMSFYAKGISSLIILLLICYRFIRRKGTKTEVQIAGEFKLPETISAVSALKFLHQIRHSSHPLAANAALQHDIENIEKSFFSKSTDSKLDLNQLVNNWYAKVS